MVQGLLLRSIDRKAGTAQVRFKSRLDPASMAASMKVALGNLLKRMGKPDQQAQMERQLAGKMSMEKTVEADAVVSLSDGWARRIDIKERIDMKMPGQNGGRSEHVSMTIERL
jgi:hypothetical protein